MGLMGLRSGDEHIPDAYFRLPPRQLRLFLSRLYAADGWASIQRTARRPGNRPSLAVQVGYCSVSERLARDVQHLLLRLGISANLQRKKVTYKGESRTGWQVCIRHGKQVARFCREIGIFSKERQTQAVLGAMGERVALASTDTIPRAVWATILREKGALSWAEVSARCGRPRNHNLHVGAQDVGRERLA